MKIYKALLMIVLFSSAYISGAFFAAVRCMGQIEDKTIPFTVIMYHNISPKPSLQGKYCVSVNEFEQDLKYLQDHGYNAVSMKEVTDFAYNGTPLPDKPVLITFDDGHEGFYIYAYPLLKKYGYKAVVNIVGSFAEQYTKLEAENAPDAHNPDYAYMTFKELDELNKSGIVEIGDHTYDMHKLNGTRRGCSKRSGESAENYRTVLSDDLTKAQKLLGYACGEEPYIFAYPYGIYSKETPEILRKAGFKAVFNCTEKINHISCDNIDWLFDICRYNRPSGISSNTFFAKME